MALFDDRMVAAIIGRIAHHGQLVVFERGQRAPTHADPVVLRES